MPNALGRWHILEHALHAAGFPPAAPEALEDLEDAKDAVGHEAVQDGLPRETTRSIPKHHTKVVLQSRTDQDTSIPWNR